MDSPLNKVWRIINPVKTATIMPKTYKANTRFCPPTGKKAAEGEFSTIGTQ
jgi:hypothetical protein